jgi:hypothetical protein
MIQEVDRRIFQLRASEEHARRAFDLAAIQTGRIDGLSRASTQHPVYYDRLHHHYIIKDMPLQSHTFDSRQTVSTCAETVDRDS